LIIAMRTILVHFVESIIFLRLSSPASTPSSNSKQGLPDSGQSFCKPMRDGSEIA
jgi:hypothetical protein